jgi:murein DD-endopeptidase MepM/ murein hydrolase activator NlpD
MHKGVDFAAPRGTPIFSAGDGYVERIGPWSSYGNYIRIRHGDTYSTAYAHMKGFARGLRKGQRIRQGQVIGYVGTTGRSTGPHLHYEVLKNGKQVNPSKVTMPPGRHLKGKELDEFNRMKNQVRQQYAQTPVRTKMASNN